MFFDDHEPPHVHVEHQGQLATFDFAGKLPAGELRSVRARRLVREWARLREHGLCETGTSEYTGLSAHH